METLTNSPGNEQDDQYSANTQEPDETGINDDSEDDEYTDTDEPDENDEDDENENDEDDEADEDVTQTSGQGSENERSDGSE